ncbi:MAG: hypothetical protein ACP5RP_04060 [Candidatus Micrarchaeia archaeon]
MAENNAVSKLETSAKFVNTITKYFLESELNSKIDSIFDYISQSFFGDTLPYFVASAIFIIFCRPISKNNLRKLFISAGEIPDQLLIETIDNLHYKNYLIYIIALMFLIEVKQEVTKQKILDIISAFNIEPDVETAKESINIYNQFAQQAGLAVIPPLQDW